MFSQILLVILCWVPFNNHLDNITEPNKKDTPNKTNTYLNWNSNRKLTWNDFQKEADASDPLHAMTSTNISVQAHCDGNEMKFDVKCQFAVLDSWTKNKSSESLLQHEQLHFDITEIYARQLRQKLEQQKSLCTGDKRKFNAVVNKVFADWKKTQERYDAESKHGIDDAKQQQWTENVANLLTSLEAYQDRQGIVAK